ncbi:MAG: carbon monoxide dehydrogenase subunit G [Gammaproteobacteria bacterium]|nr:carbon monoxide dehydrogenase subunit G [Gammaproteobacteria bacterium]
MIFQGEEPFGYAVQDVWTALHDVGILTKAIPGCRSMTPMGDNRYAVRLSLGVAAVRGEYEGTVKVTDDKPLSHYVIEGNGKGAPGFVKLRMDCWFESQPAGTLMRWQCDATVGGLIASVGGKVLAGVSKFMAQQFFRSFKDELRRIAAPTGDESKIVRAPAATQANAVALDASAARSEGWLARLLTAFKRLFSHQPS